MSDQHDAEVEYKGQKYTLDFKTTSEKFGYSMPDRPDILTSNSAYRAFQDCNRERYWGYEALTPAGTRGYERKSLSLPLATGGWIHKVAEGLFTDALGGDLGRWQESIDLDPLPGLSGPQAVIQSAKRGYQDEAHTRGLDLGLAMDGSVPEEQVVERVIEEQSALLEAFGWAFLRVRLPKLLEEYELVDVEREEVSLLSADVGLQGRCDAVLRRKSDQKLFIYNLKTSGNPDKRWADQWQVDGQLMTETLAVERRLGERVWGVIIDGFDKGQRVKLDYATFKEVKQPKEGQVVYEGQRNRLIYGYKCEETVPGRPTLYDWEGTTRKGWEKFAVWREGFSNPYQPTMTSSAWPPTSNVSEAQSPVQYWVNWLPIEQVEAAFHTLPPIEVNERRREPIVRQVVEQERRIREYRDRMEPNPQMAPNFYQAQLDEFWPQAFKHCVYPSRCPFYLICHEGVDPAQDDRFQPRTPNHPTEVE